MVGKYEIEVYNNRVHFFLEIRRNITIIQGNSATGKTTLVGLISDHERLGEGSGVTLKCERPCVVLNGQDWHHYIETRNGHIIFVDENMPALRSTEFAETVANSDNYFVIIYRDSLPQLPYSIEEIYGLHEDRDTQKYVKPKRVYNTMFQIYNPDDRSLLAPDLAITEDSNAGYKFFNEALSCPCACASGKSKVADKILQCEEAGNSIVAIVDGAAFGSDMEKYSRVARSIRSKCYLYAPESFEYLLLKSGIVDVDQDMVDHTYNYADSADYISWERFYTSLLYEVTKDTIYSYSKLRLNDAYLTEGNIKKVLEQIPEVLKSENRR